MLPSQIARLSQSNMTKTISLFQEIFGKNFSGKSSIIDSFLYTLFNSTSKNVRKNLNIIKTNRGGKYTYHGPGQKVVYFVLNLNKREKDIRKLISKVENCIMDILKEYKIKSYNDKKNIGIWVGNKNNSKKIAAIGLRVKKWVAYHGFAINVSNDLTRYRGIIPCGIKNKGITSLKEMGINNYNNIEEVIINKFLNIFP